MGSNIPNIVKNAIGKRSGNLVISAYSHSEPYFVNGKIDQYKIFVEVTCDCGVKKVVAFSNVYYGRNKSCGCIRNRLISQSKIKHGHAGTPEYSSWHHMISRCTDKSNLNYKNYGGRGIKVCSRWLKFENFLLDMGKRPIGGTLDRYPNNNGDYKPSNCRWATRKQQNENKRNNRVIEYNGEKYLFSELVKKYNIPHGRLFRRLKSGWQIEKALLTPKRNKK